MVINWLAFVSVNVWRSFINLSHHNIGCSLKFPVEVGVEESIVKAPLVSLQNKNRNNAKSEVRFKQLYHPWCIHNRLFKANFDGKF
jgi:hypothetical protein